MDTSAVALNIVYKLQERGIGPKLARDIINKITEGNA